MARKNVQQMFREAAERFSSAVAIDQAGGRWTYRHVEEESNRLANFLVLEGVAPGSLVAIFAERTAHVVPAILGILKAGCAFVPLDVDMPEKRLAALMAEVAPRWILGESRFLEKMVAMAAAPIEIVCLDETPAPQPAALGEGVTLHDEYRRFERREGVDRPMDPDALCYVYFTSGSTGAPKAIAGRLKAIDHFVRWEAETFGVSAGTRVSQLTNPSFDAYLRDIFVPLVRGGTICAPPARETLLDARQLVDWLAEAEIHLVHCVPSLFRLIVSERPRRPRPASLKLVFLAGETLLPSDVKRSLEVLGERVQLVNLYGSSETTMTKFFYRVRPSDTDRKRIPIGKPMPGAAAIIVDEEGNVCPPGAVGEIYVRTPARSRGYYGRPDLSEQVFIPNPFGRDPNDLVYKTGDLGRLLRDGDFEFLGRRDRQVKVRGVRVEPGEIEAILRDHSGVLDAAVVDRDDADGNKTLWAYVVLRDPAEPAQLRGELRRSLPAAMVPSVFLTLDKLPRTPSGKVDRRQLPVPKGVQGTSTAAPGTPTEELLADIWGAVLGARGVGAHDNFFDLGGHSLVATQVVSRVSRVFGIEVPLGSLFEAPTIAGLARRVDAALGGGKRPEIPPIRPVPRDGDLPLSFAQQRLWFLDRLAPGSSAYNLASVVRWPGALDPAVLESACREIVGRHEALRTTFRAVDGKPFQVIAPQPRLDLAVADLAALSLPAEDRAVRRLIARETSRPFDLARGPLLRLLLLRLGESEHVMVLTVHHIVTDAWSMELLVREFARVYEAFSKGRPASLPELPVQYADFASWQREWLRAEVLESHLAYWKRRLGTDVPVLQLPTDRPRPSFPTLRGARHPLTLRRNLPEHLQELGQERGVTLFMTLLAGFQALLHRYSGQPKIAVGSPIANRNRLEIEGLAGFFVNTLVLQCDLAGDPSFPEVLDQVRQVALEAYGHQDLPFEKLVEELRPERTTGHTPLFQVVFAFQNVRAQPGPAEWKLSPLPVEIETARFDLTLSLIASGSVLGGVLEYATDLFDRLTVARLARHLETVLEGIVRRPGRRLSELPFLAAAERHQVLAEWNDTARYRGGALASASSGGRAASSVHQLFEARAEAGPEAAAVIAESRHLTYRELNRRSNRLAHFLLELGVAPGQPIGIFIERSPELIVGLMAILKAGGAYVPLDPAHPRERVALLLETTATTIVLTRKHLVAELGRPGIRVLDTDAAGQPSALLSSRNPGSGGGGDSLAYVLFTSGSTGIPRGVEVTHRGLLNTALAQSFDLGVGPGDRILQSLSITFDGSVWQIFVSLVSGAALVLPRPEELLPGPGFVELLARQKVNLLAHTPSVLALLPEAELPALSTIVSAGEALRRDVVIRWAPGRRFVNAYGPTEITVNASCARVGADLDRPIIGRPMDNTCLFVADRRLRLLPAVASGELLVAGAGVARGYLGCPRPTAEKFVPNPFVHEPGSRLYRTGDLARYQPDGDVEFLGRIDQQVKLRGFRIEPGEIEATLRRHPAVHEAAVVAREEAHRLIAYVVVMGGAGEVREEIRSFLSARLPGHMVPSRIVVLDEPLPRTHRGKIDRQNLPEPALMEAEEEKDLARNPTEEMLSGIWSELLEVRRIDVHDDFFALGGHSLLATRVMSRVARDFGVDLPLRLLFEFPTVAALARQIETERTKGAGLPAPPLVAAERQPGATFPLSFAQQRLWFVQQMVPESPAYNIAVAALLSGSLDVGVLGHSLDELVRRHETLRTSFEVRDGRPRQAVAPHRAAGLPLVDLSALAPDRQHAETPRLSAGEGRRLFDLTRGSLLRATLLRRSEDLHALLLSLHHIVSDGWSMGILLRELTVLYNAFSAGRRSPLPELTVQYADFASWQREWLAGEVLAAQLAFWKDRLSGAPAVIELPADRARPVIRTYRGASEAVHVPGDLSSDLVVLSRRSGATLFMTLLAAFETLLHRITGQTDLVIGTPIANRNRVEVEELIGFFINTLALRTNFATNPSFQELLERVRESTLEAYVHQDLPFEMLVEELVPERDLSHLPVVQVMLVLQTAPLAPLELPGLTLRPLAVETETAKFDLTLNLRESGDRLTGFLEYSTDLFDATTIRRLLGHWQRVLAQLVAEPRRRLGNFDLLGAAERHELLAEWNDTRASYPEERCVHELFEAQARRAPETVAVTCRQRNLTYGELDRRASRLAQELIGLGVAPEVLLGVLLERSPELVVAVLGILKAGGVYVPLEPGHPPERLKGMIEDAGIELLVTRQGGPIPWFEALPGRRVIRVDADRTLPARPDEKARSWPQARSYVIYTSGSTGQPKGISVTHRAITRLVLGTDYVKLTSAERIAHASNTAFDAATFEIWGALLQGACLVVMAPDVLLSPEDFARELKQRRISVLFMTTALFNEMARQAPEAFDTLHTLLFGGEAVDPQWVRRVLETPAPHRRPERLLHVYGPTEGTTFTTWHRVRQAPPQALTIPIGRPIANARTYVADRFARPVPAGVIGELFIGGDGLARDYLDRPRLVAEKYVPDACGDEPGGRLYRTGDRVRQTASGAIEFVGRIDHQIKLRGFRIELGEIESVLSAHPKVDEAVVVARRSKPSEQRLVAYVVPRAGAEKEALASRLPVFLKERLPAYMAPHAFVVLESLPLTPNGKVDREALPVPASTRPELEVGLVPARTEVERRLAEIWSQLLGVEPIGIHDNFFLLGGDSILSIQVVARARRAGLRLTPQELFRHQTIAELAAVAEKTGAGTSAHGPVTGAVPLTPIQKWMFERDLLNPHHFNQAFLFELHDPPSRDSLREALRCLMNHHDVLRSCFAVVPGQQRQVLAGPHDPQGDDVPLSWMDLSALPEAVRGPALGQAADLAQSSLDIVRGPVLRFVVLDPGPDEPAHLLVVVHHLVVDGVSWRILLEDLQNLHQQLENGSTAELPERTTSWKEWAERLWQYAGSPAARAELDDWLAQGAPHPAPLPTDHLTGPNDEASGRAAVVFLDTEETRALLQEVHEAYQTQINDVLLTALARAMTRWTNDSRLRIYLEGHGREPLFEDVDLSRTVGWFTTLFPVLLDLGEADGPGPALKAVKERLRRIPGHGIGYGLLRYSGEDPEIAGKLRAIPQPEVAFNYLGQLDRALPRNARFAVASRQSRLVRHPREPRAHVLEVSAYVRDSRLLASWTYSENLHRQDTVEGLARSFITELRRLIEHCRSPEADGYTPSDFPDMGFDQQELDELIGELSESVELES